MLLLTWQALPQVGRMDGILRDDPLERRHPDPPEERRLLPAGDRPQRSGENPKGADDPVRMQVVGLHEARAAGTVRQAIGSMIRVRGPAGWLTIEPVVLSERPLVYGTR
jgi:hypothetical protein